MNTFEVGDEVELVDDVDFPLPYRAGARFKVHERNKSGTAIKMLDKDGGTVGGGLFYMACRFRLVGAAAPSVDPIKPSYYGITVKGVTFDAIDLWTALNLPPCPATALKYIVRAGRKTPDRVQDLKKAVEFLNREITRLESEPKK